MLLSKEAKEEQKKLLTAIIYDRRNPSAKEAYAQWLERHDDLLQADYIREISKCGTVKSAKLEVDPVKPGQPQKKEEDRKYVLPGMTSSSEKFAKSILKIIKMEGLEVEEGAEAQATEPQEKDAGKTGKKTAKRTMLSITLSEAKLLRGDPCISSTHDNDVIAILDKYAPDADLSDVMVKNLPDEKQTDRKARISMAVAIAMCVRTLEPTTRSDLLEPYKWVLDHLDQTDFTNERKARIADCIDTQAKLVINEKKGGGFAKNWKTLSATSVAKKDEYSRADVMEHESGTPSETPSRDEILTRRTGRASRNGGSERF